MKMIKKNIWIVAVLAAALTTTSCQVNDYGDNSAALASYQLPETHVYSWQDVHPCAVYSKADFQRVKNLVQAEQLSEMAAKEYGYLKSSSYTKYASYEATPQEKIVRGSTTGTGYSKETYGYAMRDATAAKQMGMMWQLTGNENYAKKGIEILNAWAQTCTAVTAGDNNKYLASGQEGFIFAQAGELLRDYDADTYTDGWTASDFKDFKNWMVNVFVTMNEAFLVHNFESCGSVRHYWSNWDMLQLVSLLQIGILCENDDYINKVVTYFYSGVGNGNVDHIVVGDPHTDPLGSGETLYQNQESGRDQGHAQMSSMVCANLARMAWSLMQSNETNKGFENLDFYSYDDCKLLKMWEFVALTNFKTGEDGIVYDPVDDCYRFAGTWMVEQSVIDGNAWTTVGPYCTDTSHEPDQSMSCLSYSRLNWDGGSSYDSGRGQLRPGWESVYKHYSALGKPCKYVKLFADKLRPECGPGVSARPYYGSNSGAFDQAGWGTLMLDGAEY